MRYLVYYVTKQCSPWFTDDFERWQDDADSCSAVIVDTVEKRRYWFGRWEPCDIHGATA